MIDNYNDFKLFLDKKIKNLSEKPKLLLHTCCAPCSSYTIKFLKDYFDITIFLLYSSSSAFPPQIPSHLPM